MASATHYPLWGIHMQHAIDSAPKPLLVQPIRVGGISMRHHNTGPDHIPSDSAIEMAIRKSAPSAEAVLTPISAKNNTAKVVGKNEESAIDNNDNLTSESVPIDERWRPLRPITLREIPGVYMELTKMRLSGLVLLTTMVGYAIAPGVVSPSALFWTSVGTAMCVSSANCINQWSEVPFDAQMSRTRNRALVRQALSPLHALTFGIAIGAVGTGLLCVQVNSLVAALGFANILLYTCVYTPSKRTTILNTWYGAVVGAIPPMMGWAACTGGLEDGAWVLAGLLYAWQFPHFNSLSWNLRQDYSKAGYRMMAVTDPALCKRVALRYAALMFPLSLLCPYLDMTTWNFAYSSSALNAYLLYGSWRFYQDANAKTARGLFFASIVHLPILLSLLLIHKKTKKPKPLDETQREFLLDSSMVEPVGSVETITSSNTTSG